MKNLVEQLLFLARGINGKTQLTITEFSLSDMIKNVVEESKMIDDKHIYSYIKLEDVNIYGDSGLLKQTARILVENAAKYTEEGEDIILKIGRNNKGEAYFSVQDNGIGMDEKSVIKAFEKGYTGKNGRKFVKSTGMGLYLCKKLCEKLGLGINIKSKENEGTEVTILLPINDMMKF